jgi:undecaprenyl-diphosphatase
MAFLARAASSLGRRRDRLSVGQAVVLGLIQGPAEVLPVSSSGHLVLIPALLDWPYARLPADVRKSFEVALHAGAGFALLWILRRDAAEAARDPIGTTLMTAPAAAVALAFEDRIEERASSPHIAAVAQIVSATAMAAARPGSRSHAGARDRLAVGAAQAAALVPGVSRNGATLTAARALGFDRETAARLSWQAGLPIIGGATALKLVRLWQHGLDRDLRAPFAAGAAAAFAATLAAAPLIRVRRQRLIAAYRIALGAFALHRLEWPRG